MVYMCHIFFFQSTIDGHLGWCQVFAIVSSAAVNIHVPLFLRFPFGPLGQDRVHSVNWGLRILVLFLVGDTDPSQFALS